MKKNNKGFTLAELLIVVAIIAVLVAVAIPTFTSQLEKSKQAVDEANCRSAYAEAVATYLTDTKTASGTVTVNGKSYTWSYADNVTTVTSGSDATQSTKYANGITYNGTKFDPVAKSGV